MAVADSFRGITASDHAYASLNRGPMSPYPDSRPRRPVLIGVAAAALLLCSLAACGSTDAGSSAASAPTGSAATATATAGADPAAPEKAVSAAELCGFLEKNLAEWQSIGSAVGAMARLTTDLAGFYEDHGVTPVGSDMDEQTLAECPKTREKVLKAGGLASFQAL